MSMPENPQEETIKKGGIESAFDSISPIGDSSREDVLTKREIIEAEYADNESVIEKIKGIAAAMGFNLTKTIEEKTKNREEILKRRGVTKEQDQNKKKDVLERRQNTKIIGDETQIKRLSLENEMVSLQGNIFNADTLRQLDEELFSANISDDKIIEVAEKRIEEIKNEIDTIKLSELEKLQDNPQNSDDFKRINVLRKELTKNSPEKMLKYEINFLQKNCRNYETLRQWDKKTFKENMPDDEIFEAVGDRIEKIKKELKITSPETSLDAELKKIQVADRSNENNKRIIEVETKIEENQASLLVNNQYEREIWSNNIEIDGGFPENEDGLRLVEEKYLESITKQMQKNKAMNREMESLGIKKSKETITKNHCYKLMQRYDKGELSDNARRFIRRVEPQYFKHILSEVRQKKYTL